MHERAERRETITRVAAIAAAVIAFVGVHDTAAFRSGVGIFQKDSHEYLIVSPRLLANEGAPVDFAVGGTLTPEQSIKAHTLAETRAQPEHLISRWSIG